MADKCSRRRTKRAHDDDDGDDCHHQLKCKRQRMQDDDQQLIINNPTDIFSSAVNDLVTKQEKIGVDSVLEAIVDQSFAMWQDRYAGMREELKFLSSIANNLWAKLETFIENFYWIQTAQQVGVMKELSSKHGHNQQSNHSKSQGNKRRRRGHDAMMNERFKTGTKMSSNNISNNSSNLLEEELRTDGSDEGHNKNSLQCELLNALQAELRTKLDAGKTFGAGLAGSLPRGENNNQVYEAAKDAIRSFLVQSLTNAIKNVTSLSPAEGEWIRQRLDEHAVSLLQGVDQGQQSVDQQDSEVVKMAADNTVAPAKDNSEDSRRKPSDKGVEPLDVVEPNSCVNRKKSRSFPKTSIPEVDPKTESTSIITGQISASESGSNLTSIESPDSYDPKHRLTTFSQAEHEKKAPITSPRTTPLACSSCLTKGNKNVSSPSTYTSIFSNVSSTVQNPPPSKSEEKTNVSSQFNSIFSEKTSQQHSHNHHQHETKPCPSSSHSHHHVSNHKHQTPSGASSVNSPAQVLRDTLGACEPCKKFFEPENNKSTEDSTLDNSNNKLNEAPVESLLDTEAAFSPPKAFVLYELDDAWTPEERAKVLSALEQFNQETLLTFYPRSLTPQVLMADDDDDDAGASCQPLPYLKIVKGDLCSSMVGYKQVAADMGTPTVVMSPNCLKPETATHELVHAVAFYHEEAGPDSRKDIIQIGYPEKQCAQLQQA